MGENQGKGAGVEGLKDPLDEEIKKANESLADELKRARARDVRAGLNLSARQKEEQEALGRSGEAKERAGNISGEGRETRWSVIDGKPVRDPDGEYDSFLQAYKVAALEVGKQNNNGGDSTLTILTNLQKLGILGGKSDSLTDKLATKYLDELDTKLMARAGGNDSTEVSALRTEMANLRQEIARNSDPMEIARRYKGLVSSFEEAGFVSKPAPTGKTIEEVKEDHHYELEKKKIDGELEHKRSLANAVGKLADDIPEALGGFLALRGEGSGGNSPKKDSKGGLPSFPCEKCHKPITVPPDAGDSITCPWCGQVHIRQAKVPEQEKKATVEMEA